LSRQPGMSIKEDYSEALGIRQEASDAFFGRISCTIEHLRTETTRHQSYDGDWLYTWNPLEATPLIQFDPKFPDRVLCPIPRYLLFRAISGIFYDLVRSSDFDNPYGNAFQAYVGDVIEKVFPTPGFTIFAEKPYRVGNRKMHGIDWVVSDGTGHVPIESKTKRLTLNAKTMS